MWMYSKTAYSVLIFFFLISLSDLFESLQLLFTVTKRTLEFSLIYKFEFWIILKRGSRKLNAKKCETTQLSRMNNYYLQSISFSSATEFTTETILIYFVLTSIIFAENKQGCKIHYHAFVVQFGKLRIILKNLCFLEFAASISPFVSPSQQYFKFHLAKLPISRVRFSWSDEDKKKQIAIS